VEVIRVELRVGRGGSLEKRAALEGVAGAGVNQAGVVEDVGVGRRRFQWTRGEEGLRHASVGQPDLVILDLGLPDVDGIEVTRRLRAWTAVPIIVVSARGREQDKVAALDAGADDYLTKPFGVGELLARLRVALRHLAAADGDTGDPVFAAGDLRVDLARREVSVAGAVVRLTPNEFRLLAVLVENAGKVLVHRQLLREVWGPGSADDTHYLRVYMNQLRQKIEPNPSRPRYLLTEPGVGYRLTCNLS
jgi:two-component system KDP operon response regulator KdpE